jgi:hypothetical protein
MREEGEAGSIVNTEKTLKNWHPPLCQFPKLKAVVRYAP